MWEQLRQIQFPKRKEDNPQDEQIKQIYRLSYNLNFFCDEVREYNYTTFLASNFVFAFLHFI